MSSKQTLSAKLQPLVEILGRLDLTDPEAAAAILQREAPIEGELVQDIRAQTVRGFEQGWLLDKDAGGVRFGRIAKDLGGFSVDAVLLDHRSGPRHRHPNGEVDLLFGMEGTPHFDGHPIGWAVYPPGSEHVPGVKDGVMLILYFLPGGEIEFL
jgi:hypothetical protein